MVARLYTSIGFAWAEGTQPQVWDVTVYLPLCDACESEKPIAPEWVDFGLRTMKFAVHPEFRRIVRQHEAGSQYRTVGTPGDFLRDQLEDS